MLLELTGNETRAAYDGLDIGLPELNGYEVARTTREERWGTQIMLVALTGWGAG